MEEIFLEEELFLIEVKARLHDLFAPDVLVDNSFLKDEPTSPRPCNVLFSTPETSEIPNTHKIPETPETPEIPDNSEEQKLIFIYSFRDGHPSLSRIELIFIDLIFSEFKLGIRIGAMYETAVGYKDFLEEKDLTLDQIEIETKVGMFPFLLGNPWTERLPEKIIFHKKKNKKKKRG